MIGGQTKTRRDVLFERKRDYVAAPPSLQNMCRGGADVTFTTYGQGSVARFRDEDLHGAGITVNASSTARADRQQERHRRRRLPPAQGRHARQFVDLGQNSQCDDQVDRNRRRSGSSIQISGTASSPQDDPRIHPRSSPASFKVRQPGGERWGNIIDFQGFDLITPNEREARFALAIRIQACARSPPCSRQGQLQLLMLKLGAGHAGLPRRRS